MKHQIKHRYTDAVLFECELPDDTPSGMAVRLSLEKASTSGADLSDADLSRANLSWANLSRANLSQADLSWANLSQADLSWANLSQADLSEANLSQADLSQADLSWANLSRANLSEANLSRANLSEADLSQADLSQADLSWANLSRANLSEANLSEANLSRANLSRANLSEANLSRANLSEAKNDFWEILLRAPREIAGLRAALVAGKVNGSTYEGACACLVGTIANVRGHVDYHDLGNGLKPNSSRPAERWFLGIGTGDAPETNPISAITVEWLDEFMGLLTAAQVQS